MKNFLDTLPTIISTSFFIFLCFVVIPIAIVFALWKPGIIVIVAILYFLVDRYKK